MRVVVADDADRVRTALARALDLEGFQVEAVENGWAAIESVRRQTPAALILDRVMPGIDGVEVCRRLRQMGYELPILMLTVKDSVADKVEGLVAGADDYLVKPFALDELIARLQALLRRAAGPSGDLLTFADLSLDLATREAWRGERKLTLTRTEFSLLAYFMQHPRRVLVRSQILEAVWGFPEDTRSNTLEVYVGYLRRKLEEGGEPRLIETVRGVGYALRAP